MDHERGTNHLTVSLNKLLNVYILISGRNIDVVYIMDSGMKESLKGFCLS